MRYACLFLLAATPAMAHHEVVVASALPTLLPWLVFLSALVAAAWHRFWRK